MFTENNGVKIWFELHGQGEPTIILVPGFQIVHSESFKRSYVPFLSRHMRVLTLDLRGSGKSDKPEEGHDLDTYAEDLHAVVQAAGLKDFALLGVSMGTSIAVKYCVKNPGKVTRLILLSGSAKTIRSETYPAGLPEELLTTLQDMWKNQPEDMLKGFISIVCNERYCLRAKELIWKWAHEAPSSMWAKGFAVATLSDIDEDLKNIDVPTLIMHGLEDKSVLPKAAEYLHQQIRRSKLNLIAESGHAFNNTWPQVAWEVLDFVKPRTNRNRPLPQSTCECPKILWISSPIGLGHVKRDLVIASMMRKKVPQLQIDWLASGPARSVLESSGERIHPLSTALWDENAAFESCSADFCLNPTEAYWEMDNLMANNFMAFCDASIGEGYNAIVGDEAWEVHKYLHYNPTLKSAPFVFMTDFIGAMGVSQDKREKAHVKDLTGSWIEMRETHPEGCDLSIFIGEAEDLPDVPFGEGFPNIRDWGMKHFVFPGYVLPEDIDQYPSKRQEFRKELGFSPEEKILLVAVGGTSTGRPLIEKCLQAQTILTQKIPGIRTVVLSGTRIDPASFPDMHKVTVLPFVQNPLKLYTACDLAIIQAGLSTAMELTALGRPFLYFPLKNHFEQRHFVDFRLRRHNAGIPMDFDETSADVIAQTVADHIGKPTMYKKIENGAAKITDLILDVVTRRHRLVIQN